MTLSRAWHGALALVATANLLLQLALTATATDDTLGVRLVRLLSFFTVQSNVLVIVAAATLALDPLRDGRWWRVLRLDALVCIVVTGAVYLVVLRPIVHPEGWAVVTDSVFHYVVPACTLVGWWAFGPRPRVDGRTVVASLGFPLLWLAYTLVRGAIVHEYPYPFVDVDALGYGQVLLNCLGVAVLFTGLAAAAWGLERRLSPRPDAASEPAAP
ncbi:MAG TPA: Pr6Pr family membrane protein [Angustibacter sp.]|nr:Pr6Pr family membrane protein [Angustibacter sp.]